MASIQLQSPFDPPRPQSHQGIHSSPAMSPHIQRPGSQASLHLPSVSTQGYSPLPTPDGHSMSAYPMAHAQPFRPFTPSNISLPLPHHNYHGGYPSTAPPVSFFPGADGTTPLFDARGGTTMMRTVSHAHPMNSATEHTASSRYSSSPHSASNDVGPPTAGGGFPSFHIDTEPRHINPSLFHNPSQPMSRSTSGASDGNHADVRLLTPQYEYRALDINGHHMNANEADTRKVSESSFGRLPSNRYYHNHLFAGAGGTGFDHHAIGSLGAHPQPDMNISRGWGSEFALSAERGGIKVEPSSGNDTDYERERATVIMSNKKLVDDMGLGSGGAYARSVVNHHRMRKASTPVKKRVMSMEQPVRVSPRIASLHRASYADLDEGPIEEDDEEEDYNSEDDLDEDEFRPSKKSKGMRGGYRKASYNAGRKSSRKPDLSLWGLLQIYSEIPVLFPLFYYTMNNDLTINPDSVPLIGSIPSTVTPLEKSDTLKDFFHRGRRVLAQLDYFTSRCDRKYDGPEERWAEMDFHTRIAVRDVRRKVVERCENYKYTRRDILDKTVGKGKWAPIENGMIEWKPGTENNDPAGDLVNVTLTLPTPPPQAYAQQQAQSQRQLGYGSDRQIRAFPSRSRMASTVPQSARMLSVTMGEPDNGYPNTSNPLMGYAYPSATVAPPMYGEDQVPMSAQLTAPVPPLTASSPLTALGTAQNPVHSSPHMQRSATDAGNMSGGSATLTSSSTGWDGNVMRGIKRSRSEDGEGEETGVGFDDDKTMAPPLWHE